LPFSFIVCEIRPHSVLVGIPLPDIFEVTNPYLTDFYATLFSDKVSTRTQYPAY